MSIKIENIICEENRDNGSIAELADNIAAVGLINPITLAPAKENGKYRVIAGRRRFLALRALQRKELTDSQYRIVDNADADMIAFCENVQRKNLTIQEELAQLRSIADRFGEEKVALLGQELGRGEKWVRTRLRLLNLAPKFAKLLGDEKIPVSFLEEIGKYPAETQARVNDWDLYNANGVKDLARRIRSAVALKFPRKMPEKCAGCQFNTGTDSLFDDVPAACTNMECAAEVTAQMLLETLKDFREKNHPVIVLKEDSNSWRLYDEIKKKAKIEFHSKYSFEEKKGGKDLAVVVDAFSVKVKAGRVYGGYRDNMIFGKKDKGSDAPDLNQQLAEAKAKLEGKRYRKALDDLLTDLNTDSCINNLMREILPQDRMIPLLLKYGYRVNHYENNKKKLADFSATPEEMAELVVDNIVQEIIENLQGIGNNTQRDLPRYKGEIERFASDLGLDWNGMYLNSAIAKIAKPKRLIELEEEIKKQKTEKKSCAK